MPDTAGLRCKGSRYVAVPRTVVRHVEGPHSTDHDLMLTYDGTKVPLACAPALAYVLNVSRTDITGDRPR